MEHGARHLEDVTGILNMSTAAMISHMVGEIPICASLWVGGVGRGESPFVFLLFTLKLKDLEHHSQGFTAPRWLF